MSKIIVIIIMAFAIYSFYKLINEQSVKNCIKKSIKKYFKDDDHQ